MDANSFAGHLLTILLFQQVLSLNVRLFIKSVLSLSGLALVILRYFFLDSVGKSGLFSRSFKIFFLFYSFIVILKTSEKKKKKNTAAAT